MAGQFGPTEDTPATPGWVEERLDELIGELPPDIAAAVQAERGPYLDCLAGSVGPLDPEVQHTRCHVLMLRRLRAAGLERGALDDLGRRLEALEDEFAGRT